MRTIISVSIIFTFLCMGLYAQETKIPIRKNPNPIPTTKPHAPTKINVEAWIDGSILTVTFLQPEGDASITFESTISPTQEESVYTTTSPILIDLAPYGEVFSFTIETNSGNTYVGTF